MREDTLKSEIRNLFFLNSQFSCHFHHLTRTVACVILGSVMAY